MQHLPVPAELTRHEAYAPVVRLLKDTLIRPKDIAARWQIGQSHLANLRRAGRGLPWTRLPTGAKGLGSVRYRLADIVTAELHGTSGSITAERVCLAIAACDLLSLEQRAAVQAYLGAALGFPVADDAPPNDLAPRGRGRPRNAA
jgi:hypothetical protein